LVETSPEDNVLPQTAHGTSDLRTKLGENIRDVKNAVTRLLGTFS